MPKILINEIDKTTPGTPDGYTNYSVLIAGLQKEFTKTELENAKAEIVAYNEAVASAKQNDENIELPELSANALMIKARDEKADYNGVYEFSSAQDFLNTVGPVAPHVLQKAIDEHKYLNYSHYGNQMAYELLKQGYTVIYRPVAKEDLVTTLLDSATWDIFKDKSSYDFRFVHHGLLESTDSAVFAGINALKREAEARKEAIEDTIAEFTKGDTPIINKEAFEALTPNQQLEGVISSQESYEALLSNYKELGKVNDVLQAPSGTAADLVTDNGYFALASNAIMHLVDQRATIEVELDNIKNEQAILETGVITDGAINDINTNIANLAKYATEDSTDTIPGRGDCVALIELDENAYVHTISRPEITIIDAINSMSIDKSIGKYCALTVPSVVYNMADTSATINGELVTNAYNSNKKFPGGFHYLACFMNSLKSNFREWYAAAGYTRGVSSYTIKHTTVPLGEIAINVLEPRAKTSKDSPKFACNVIANFRGSYYLWGNRTAHPLDPAAAGGDLVASHFLNIRQLCCTIKKQLYVACRIFTFDPNSDTLWFNFVNAIKPTLEAMKADQGIRDYKIMKVTTDKKATLKAKIRIIPIEAVEDFDLTVSLEDSFGETAAVVTE